MRDLLANGWRSLWHSPALRRAFCARHVGAGLTSLAIHALAVGSVLWLSSRALGIGGAGTAAVAAKRITPPLALFAQAQSANTNAKAQSERPSAKPLLQASKDTGPAKVGIPMEQGESTLPFPGFTFDVAKLVSRGTTLFPFLTRTLSFNVEEKPEKRATPLVNPFSTQSLEVRETPLVMTEAEVQRLVDEAWARRERWGPFQRIRALAEAHHPDVGQVPALLRGHVNQNALQPYVETKMRDPRVWTQLALVADHELFLDFIADYVSRHPGTKGSVELLFLLDILAQGSLDTLQVFMEVEPDRDLKWTRRMNPTAFDAIVEIRDYYVEQRKKRGLDSYRALARHYDQIRAHILTTIMQTAPAGYRVDDARYLLGELHWRRQRYADARRAWSQMRVDPQGRYAEASSAVLQALRDADARRPAPPPPEARRGRPVFKNDDANFEFELRAINDILEAEYQRWVTFSRDRLRRFGYELDAF